MNPLVFWNELAERPLAADNRVARQRMDQLIDTLAALRREAPTSPAPRLRSTVPLDGVALAEGYTVARWRVETDQIRRMFFIQLATSSPLLREAVDAAEALDLFGAYDCWHQDERAFGLLAAWAAEELAVSLDSNQCWQRPLLAVEVETLSEKAEIERRHEDVRHIADAAHVDAHRDWLRERRFQSIDDGRDLWDRRRELFPHLEMCREVQQQLEVLDPGSPEFRNVARRLFEVERAFAVWDGCPIHPAFLPSKCTPETPQTLKEEADAHTSTRENGVRHLFSWHVRFTPGAGRVFFDCDSASQRGLVGYVGFKKGRKLT